MWGAQKSDLERANPRGTCRTRKFSPKYFGCNWKYIILHQQCSLLFSKYNKVYLRPIKSCSNLLLHTIILLLVWISIGPQQTASSLLWRTQQHHPEKSMIDYSWNRSILLGLFDSLVVFRSVMMTCCCLWGASAKSTELIAWKLDFKM